MDRLTATLRLAKVFCCQWDRTEIDLDCYRHALEYIELGAADIDLLRQRLDRWSPPDAPRPGGAALVERYAADPAISLSSELVELRTVLRDAGWESQPAVFAPGETHAPVSGGAGPEPLDAWMENCHQVLFGQDAALDCLRDELTEYEAGLCQRRPFALCLAGPSGAGKSALLQLLARRYPERPVLTLNMSSYQSEREGFGLTGLRNGWSDAGPGRLTAFVQSHPNAIVIFDHVDKAHPAVLELLAPMLSDACLDDEFGFGGDPARGKPATRSVDFKRALLCFTSTAGSAVYDEPHFDRLLARDPGQAIDRLRSALAAPQPGDGHSSASAFLSHLARLPLLPFRHLDFAARVAIARHRTAAVADLLAKAEVTLTIEAPDALAFALVLAHGAEVHAAQLDSVFQPVTRAFAKTRSAATRQVHVSVEASATLTRLLADDWRRLQRDMLRRNECLRFTVDARLEEEGTEVRIALRELRLERIHTQDYGEGEGLFVEVPTQRFDRIFGHVYIKQRLRQVVRLLTEPALFGDQPLPVPRGMLLHGTPGTGKTMLARALAAEAAMPFIAVAAPQLLRPDLIREIFQRARKYAPSIVFIDEIDALGVRGRGGADLGINQLLAEIDGFQRGDDSAIFVIAATNFPEQVDPALTRSGRLDLVLQVPLLDREARAQFIRKLMDLPHDDAWDADVFLDLTAGMSGADLDKVVRECILEMVRRGLQTLTRADVMEQLNSMRFGRRVEHPRLREQIESTAYHEAGHAVVSFALDPGIRIQQVTIVARGQAAGVTAYDAESWSRPNLNRQQVMQRICTALAGRVAEARFGVLSGHPGELDSGASSDLAQASRMAWLAITEWGLDEDFGWVALEGLDPQAQQVLHGRALTRLQHWLAEARKETEQLVEQRWPQIDRVARYLLDHELIEGHMLQEIVRGDS